MKILDIAATVLLGIGAILLFIAFANSCFTFSP